MFKTLQAGRAVAAGLVVLFHLNGLIESYLDSELWAGFRMGHAGVHFFFVLSGFIIASAHWRDLGQPAALGRYAWRRFVRIYPAYWFVLLALIPVYLTIPSFGSGYEREPAEILASIALYPTWNPPLLTVAWTLRHEVLFYLLFAILIFHRRAGATILVLWLAGCVATAVGLLSPTSPVTGLLLAPINLLFFMGLLAAWILRRRTIPGAVWVTLAGVVIFAATGTVDVFMGNGTQTAATLVYGLGGSLIVLGATELERSGVLDRTPDLLVVAGDASYAAYLVHYPVLSMVAKVWFGLTPQWWPAWVSALPMLTAVCIATVAFHVAIERPSISALRKRPKTQPAAPGSV